MVNVYDTTNNTLKFYKAINTIAKGRDWFFYDSNEGIQNPISSDKKITLIFS